MHGIDSVTTGFIGSAQADLRLCCPLFAKQTSNLASCKFSFQLVSEAEQTSLSHPNSQNKFSRGIHNLCLRAAMILAIKSIHFKCMRQIYVLYIIYCCDDETIKFLFCMLMYLTRVISKSSDLPAQSDQSLASRLRILLTEHYLERLS